MDRRRGPSYIDGMRLPVVLTPGQDGFVVASCPILPGCISQGRTRSEALRNIREAIALCLDSAEEEGWRVVVPAR